MKPLIATISVTLLVLIAFTPAVAQKAGAKDINTLYKEGIQAYKDKDYTLYLERFKALDQLRPKHPVILYNLAGAHALNKQEKPAIQRLEQLILIDANKKIAQDNDFANIRELDSFKGILKKIEKFHTPVANSTVAFSLAGREMHPESIAYDPQKKTFYLSSVRLRKILWLNSRGEVKDFTTPGQDGLDAVMGIRVDAGKRLLWATSTAMPHMTGYKKEDKGRTAVFKYHLDTRKLVKKYLIDDGTDHGFDDVAIHPGGDLYVSDTRNIYRIDAGTDTLEPFLAAGSFRSLQGMDFCGGGKYLIAADWSSGLFLVDIEKRKIITAVKAPSNTSLKGIDGLYYLAENNSLLAIQNGVKPYRVMRLFLNESFSAVSAVKTIERATPHLDEPTLGVLTPEGIFYYVANSPWGKYSRDSKPLPGKMAGNIIILKTKVRK